MGHHINALIGSRRALSGLASRFGSPDPTELTPSLVILPLDEDRLDKLNMSSDESFQGFTYLTPPMAREIGNALNGEQALYIETDYFGGMGGQSAAYFENGTLTWSDAESTLYSVEQQSWLSRLLKPWRKPATKSPISQGLSKPGVVTTADGDEFDSVDLVRFTSLEALGLGDDD